MSASKLGSAIRNRRREVGLSLRELGRAAGVAPASLSAIERDSSSPTLATLHKILRALGTDFAEFFTSNASADSSPVFLGEEMKAIEDAHRKYQLLLPKRADIGFEMLHERIAPSETETAWEAHDCDFAGVLLRGGPARLELDSGEHWPVRKGDAFYIKAGQKHRLCVTSKRTVELITVWYPPRY